MFSQNPALLWVALLTLLILLFYIVITNHVGTMRGRHHVPAPQMTGHPEFERALRIQMNTLEQMVPFLISLWLCALLWNANIAAILGMFFLLGRIIYTVLYFKNPSKRLPGFIIGFISTGLLWLGALYGVLRTLLVT